MRTELKEQSEFIKVLKSLGLKAYKVNASVKGVPDIEAFLPDSNIIYKFEVKAKGGRLSEAQKEYYKSYHQTYIVIKENGKFNISLNTLGGSFPFRHKRIVFKEALKWIKD